MSVQGDPADPTSLPARIRAAEAAVARRDATFLREFDALSGEAQEAGRKGLTWLAAGGAVAGVLLLIGALRPHLGHRSPAPMRRMREGREHHGASGWIAAALPIVMSLLGSGSRHGVRLPGMAGIVWSVAQQLRGARGRRAARSGPAPQTVAQLDLQRYAGAWFEYARLPAATEAVCASDVTAHYTLDGDGTLRVLNRCLDRTGRRHDVRGIGRGGDAPGQLEVTFAPGWLQWLPFVWAPYWVLDVDADYRHALVGTPDRRHLWLLARAPVIERDALQKMVETAEAQGFPVERLRRTPQRNGG